MTQLPRLLIAATVALFSGSARAESPAIGFPLPSLDVKDQDGKTRKLSEVGEKGYVLVYFYPKADTPGCTKQACSLRDSYEKLTEKGVTIFGVSMDKEAAQKAFKDKYKLPFDLIADPEGKLVDAFGVPKMMGFSKRQAFLFKDGKLAWKDLEASTDKQAADVLKFLEAN